MIVDPLAQILLLLAAAVLVVAAARRVGLPAILGYLIVGTIFGPFALGLIDETDTTRLLAELGAFTGLDLQAGVKGEPACVSLSDGLPQSPPSQDLRPYGTRQLDADAALSAATASPGYPGKAERVILFHLEAFDWNCPQHITPRFSEAEMVQALEPVRIRIEQLEAENARLRERLSEAPP